MRKRPAQECNLPLPPRAAGRRNLLPYHRPPPSSRPNMLLVIVCVAITTYVTSQISSWMFIMTRSSKQLFSEEHDKLPILIIGGSDGSGTRAFVHAIKTLGVVIVADDRDTFDVHGQEMFHKQGWPALVNRILEVTHSGNYSFDELPDDTQQIVLREVSNFELYSRHKYYRQKQWLQSISRQGFYRISQEPPVANQVSFAMKAPVAMLVLPVLTKVFGKIKFIHVLRDGRDVALSSNQSPVLKFYNTTYPDYQNRSEVYSGDLSHVRGIQLWNDWNLQVHAWALANPDKIDYLAMRSEDLLGDPTRSRCWQVLAEFCGSPLTPSQVCCESRHTKDFGISVLHNEDNPNLGNGGIGHLPKTRMDEYPNHLNFQKHRPPAPKEEEQQLQKRLLKLKEMEINLQQRQIALEALDRSLEKREASLQQLEASLQQLETSLQQHRRRQEASNSKGGRRRLLLQEETPNVKQRYGKWRTLLANQAKLSKYLHQEGAEALNVFGYEPQREFEYSTNNNGTLACDEQLTCN